MARQEAGLYFEGGIAHYYPSGPTTRPTAVYDEQLNARGGEIEKPDNWKTSSFDYEPFPDPSHHRPSSREIQLSRERVLSPGVESPIISEEFGQSESPTYPVAA